MKLERFEFKFAVESVIAEKFYNDISNFINYDSHSKKGFYRVDSIYFDDHVLKDFHDKQNALLKRGKFRFRAYENFSRSKKFFLEYKGKHGDFVIKERITIGKDIVQKVLNGNYINSFYNYLIDKKMTPEIIAEFIKRPTLKPLSIVSYQRSAFIDKNNPNVRITFDKNIKSSSFIKNYNDYSLHMMRGGLTIIELKFERELPTYMHNAIKNFEFQRVSNSKAEFSFSENNIIYS